MGYSLYRGRPVPLEREIQAGIVIWLRLFAKAKVLVNRTERSYGKRMLGARDRDPEQRGSPDIIAALDGGRTLWLEIKRPGGKPSADQLRWHAELRALGHLVVIATCLEEVEAAIWMRR